MPVHTIATVRDEYSIFWYEESGCISVDGKLYFVSDCFYDYSGNLRTAVEHGWRTDVRHWENIRRLLWPTPTYVISLYFHEDFNRTCSVSLEQSTSILSPLKFIDGINPKFRRLQRWWRKCARVCITRRRQLAFAMASHSRLGAVSSVAALDDDVLRVILAACV
jgi:hypothetical protein